MGSPVRAVIAFLLICLMALLGGVLSSCSTLSEGTQVPMTAPANVSTEPPPSPTPGPVASGWMEPTIPDAPMVQGGFYR